MDNERYDEKKISPTVFLAITIEVALLITTIIMIVNIVKSNFTSNYGKINHDIELTNFRQIAPMLDKNTIKDVSFSVYDAIWLNTENGPDSGTIEANIREDSIVKQTFKKDQISQLYFIVDIPELGQTYQVNRIISTKDGYNEKYPLEYRMMVYCPDESQKIYSNQTCLDRYAGQAEEIIRSFNFE